MIESFADGLAGKGKQINTTLNNLSPALTALNEGRGDFFAVVHSLALFVNALHQNDQQFVGVEHRTWRSSPNSFTSTDHELANAVQQFDGLLSHGAQVPRREPRGAGPRHRQPRRRDHHGGAARTVERLETGAARLPDARRRTSARSTTRRTAQSSAIPALPNFANPMEFICSMIQAGSRLGYQDSAELCAQYLAPILDAIKFNYLPFGVNLFNTAATAAQGSRLLRGAAATPARLQGHHRSRDLVARHPVFARQHEPGWIVAPGMQGTQVSPSRRAC